jgi:amidophosphoribosyltransferase
MSDQIKHECGIALIRLLKPLEYYVVNYGSALYGLNKLYLLMEKQHNRGQDGAGVACVKFDVRPGTRYINRLRSNSAAPIKDIFTEIYSGIKKTTDSNPQRIKDPQWLKENNEFTGELFLGHLRYGTFGNNSIENCHPFLRENNWMTRNLVIAGNFNLTNVDELFTRLIDIGQHPKETSDTITVLEKIGHYLDEENEVLFRKFKTQGFSKKDISPLIATNLNVQNILSKSSLHWDGGYVIAGLFGHGDAFVMRDPSGIRPAYYYKNDELVVVTSERPVIQTAFNIPFQEIKEITPGNALIVKKNGNVAEFQCNTPTERKACSFERIYFSRGTDSEIYKERKKLGELLCDPVLKIINYDMKNTVFSFIPNTAAVAFNGMIEGLNKYCQSIKKEQILNHKGKLSPEKLDEILGFHPRVETIAVKDAKLRTFITQEKSRDDLVAHVYDITYGVVKDDVDTLVVLDDSIVRGTTLRKSIIKILDRLHPKGIIIASSAPQIRYPDCYGIDMAKLSDFIAFKAAIDLLNETRQTHIINTVYKKCKEQENKPKEQFVNHVKAIYKPFSPDRIAEKIATLITGKDIKAEVNVVFQSIENLHSACPNHKGDWYFTGDYPTPGGFKVVNRSFINFIEGKNERAY